MRTNIVTLADDDYDAVADPVIERACELVRRLGKSRAYMVPVVISALERFVEDPTSELLGGSSGPHRPHLRIHLPPPEQE